MFAPLPQPLTDVSVNIPQAAGLDMLASLVGSPMRTQWQPGVCLSDTTNLAHRRFKFSRDGEDETNKRELFIHIVLVFTVIMRG